jgi:hypothetical protein
LPIWEKDCSGDGLRVECQIVVLSGKKEKRGETSDCS